MAIASRRISPFPVALLASIIVGLVLGSAFPRPVQAANYWEFWHDIPVGATTGQTVYLNCGWHTECVDPWNSGSALDWEETNSYSYFDKTRPTQTSRTSRCSTALTARMSLPVFAIGTRAVSWLRRSTPT